MARVIVLYDADCGFCRVALALLLAWDRARRLHPVPIQGDRGAELLKQMAQHDRLASWHLRDEQGGLYSGGAGVPPLFHALPGGGAIAWTASRFPAATAHADDWVAAHRTLLGRALRERPRAWAARVLTERERA